jgi:hypothetical protein
MVETFDMTSISEFKKALRNNAKTSGGRYHKVDLHIHEPTSGDYEYRQADALEQLGKVVEANGYGLVVLLKHEQFPLPVTLETFRSYCPSTTVLPGAEINVFVDALDKKVSKDHFFHCLVIADSELEDPGYLLYEARRKLTYRDDPLPPGFHSSLDDVARHFLDAGALFIPAHLHQSQPPHKSRSIDDIYSDEGFLGFIERGHFSALEVRQPDTALFFDGKHKTQEDRPIPQITCVRSSDAHSHEHIVERNRATWIQAEAPSFSELQAALSFPHRISLEAPQTNHAQMQGMHIVGQFLADEWIAFSPAMNCFIGCKGTGKTAVLECLRFLLGCDIPKERQESVGKHIGHILGAAGSVECLVQTVEGAEYLLIRRANSPERLLAIDSQGVSREVKHAKDVGFDASILGWHEIEGVADHAHARVRLIDQIENPTELTEKSAQIEQSVEAARDLLPTFQRKVRQLDKILKQWWHLKRKRATLKILEDASLFELQNKYESYVTWEQRLAALVGEIAKAAPDVSISVGNKLQPIEDSVASPVQESSGLLETVDRVRHQVGSIRQSADATVLTLTEACRNAGAAIEKERQLLSAAFLAFRQSSYEPMVATLPPEAREILSRQIQTIEETKNLSQVEQQCKNIQREVSDLARTLHSHCEAVCTARDHIAEVRQQRINAVNAESSAIRLTLLRSSNHARRDQFQKSYREDGAAFTSFIDSYAGSDSYQKLKGLFASFINLDIEEETWALKDLILDAKFVDFLRVIDDDDVEIALIVGDAGPTAIQNLSAGQRCTAVFPLLLRNNRKPLVIDQPEDNLDNRYIADAIAPELLSKKQQQQFMLTSHNANLVVLTDAELICQFDSDGRIGKIRERGFLACGKSRVKPAVVDVLDGGEIALDARRRKYGHSK